MEWVRSTQGNKSQRKHKGLLAKMSPRRIRCLSVEEKKDWLDLKSQEMRISFLQDSITLVVKRDQILRDSFEQFRTTDGFNLHKEVKIFYVDELA